MIKIINNLSFVVLLCCVIACDTKIQSVNEVIINNKKNTLASGLNEVSMLSWSPDESMIAFSHLLKKASLLSVFLNDKTEDTYYIIDDNISIDNISLSTDGKKIVYHSNNRGYLWLLFPDNKSEILLTPDHYNACNPTWSFDSNYIGYNSDGFLFMVPVAGGKSKKILEKSGYFNPSFSPSGDRIAAMTFEKGNKDICIISISDGTVSYFTNEATPEDYPAWSPDGTRIAFVSYRNDTTGIWLKSIQDGNEYKITKDYSWASFPVWSPNGSMIAFQGSSNTTYILSISDGELIDIIGNKKVCPLWLPDNNTLLFPELLNSKVISIINTKSKKITSVTAGSENDISPTWIPDNQSLVFIRDNNIWMISAAGGEEISITDDSTKVKYNPEVSPDGLYIAFDNGYDIYIMPFNGTNAVNITKQINETLSHPTWSPDGTRIACCVPYGLKIFSLINMSDLIEDAFIPGNFSNPDWSVEHPELGSHIAVEQVIDEFFSNIYVISLNDLKPEQVIKNGKFPSWSPDGTQLAYVHLEYIYISQIFKKIE